MIHDAEDHVGRPVSDEVMDLVEHMKQSLRRGTIPVDLSGIAPGEDETGQRSSMNPTRRRQMGSRIMTVITQISRKRTSRDDMVGVS